MKIIILLCFVFITSAFANETTLSCYYDQQKRVLNVFLDGERYQQRINNYPGGICYTSENKEREYGLAAFFDGDQLIVFDVTTTSFQIERVKQYPRLNRPVVNDRLVAFFDDENLIVYDAKIGVFQKQSVNPSYSPLNLSIGKNYAALNLGQDLYLYSGTNQGFEVSNFRNNSLPQFLYSGDYFFALIIDRKLIVYQSLTDTYHQEMVGQINNPINFVKSLDSMMIYTGDQLIGFCISSNTFVKEYVLHQSSMAITNEDGFGNTMKIGDTFYTLDSESCTINRYY